MFGAWLEVIRKKVVGAWRIKHLEFNHQVE